VLLIGCVAGCVGSAAQYNCALACSGF